jgi:hypothetical protein
MGRIITAVALSGWLAILAIAYRLADNRIAVACGTMLQDGGCVARMQAKRDYILTAGLTGALAIVVVSLIAYNFTARRRERPAGSKSGWSPANRGQQARLR